MITLFNNIIGDNKSLQLLSSNGTTSDVTVHAEVSSPLAWFVSLYIAAFSGDCQQFLSVLIIHPDPVISLLIGSPLTTSELTRDLSSVMGLNTKKLLKCHHWIVYEIEMNKN